MSGFWSKSDQQNMLVLSLSSRDVRGSPRMFSGPCRGGDFLRVGFGCTHKNVQSNHRLFGAGVRKQRQEDGPDEHHLLKYQGNSILPS